MVLTISTNTSAISVQKNLNKANEAANSSLAKLSSGSRVPTAKDDAASLAIGSRVEAEIAGLKQASTNASQATSLLQIADGAYGEINDILVRQSSLAIQSASGQLSDSERAIINSEFTNLTSEVDRIANDTEFNGNKLLNGGETVVKTDEAVNGGLANKGLEISYDASAVTDGNGFTVDFKSGGNETLTLTNTTTGEVIEKDIKALLDAKAGAATDLAAGETLDIEFGDAGITVTLTDDFVRGTDFGLDTYAESAGTLDASDFKIQKTDFTSLKTSSDFNSDSGKLELTYAGGKLTGDNVTVEVDGADAVLAAGDQVTVKDAAGDVVVSFELGAAFAAGADNETITLDFSTAFTNSQTTSTDAQFDFKIGTGTVTAEDDLQVTVASATATNLGINASSVATQTDANTAIDSVKAAIDTLQGSRASVGASLSRLDFASSNLSVAIENQSAAKSGLLDVDVASETTEYAAQQVIVQAGVSLLAQANQQPSQLTKLIG